MKAHAHDAGALRWKKELGKDEWPKTWATGEPARDHNRRCWYCGSIHPDDLLTQLRLGATLDSADWKYGWPDKFYLNGIANELAGQTGWLGSENGPAIGRGGNSNRG